MTAQTPNSYFDHSSEAQAARRRGKRGNRVLLANRFFADLHAAWEEQGEAALARAAFHDPMGFARMIAMLMPQKLEVSHPVDGMTDERLADLLELAERMAALKANLVDEKRMIDVTPAEGGGGPERSDDAAGEGCPSTTRSAAPAEPPKSHNGLEQPEHLSGLDDTGSTYADRPPVGRPCPEAAPSKERRNISKLSEEVDPASLF